MGKHTRVSPEFSVSATGERKYSSSPADYLLPPGKEMLLTKGKVEAWRNTLKQSDLPDSVKLAFWNTYIVEGGNVPNPNTGSVAGITKETLADLNNRFPNRKLPSSLSELTGKNSEGKILGLYKLYFNDILNRTAKNFGFKTGIDMLGNMPAQLTCAVTDTLYQHGRVYGTDVLQKAVNDTIGKHSKASVGEDRKMGPGTFIGMATAASRDYCSLLKNIGYERGKRTSDYSSRYALFSSPLNGEPKFSSFFDNAKYSIIPFTSLKYSALKH